MKYVSSTISWLLRALITVYRYALSPVLGANCRYEPSCSCYAQDAISIHGPLRGGWMALRRIFRCHPWGGMGYDPVPTVRPSDHNHSSAATPTLTKLSEG